MFSKKTKTRKGTRPSVYTTDTGGIGIDARELFTTDAGREAMERLVGIEFRETQLACEPEPADAVEVFEAVEEDDPLTIPAQRLAR